MNTGAWIKTLLMVAALVAAIASVASHAQAWDNAVALTPPMGWNSWNKFGCNVSEDLIKSMADGMVSSGMKAAGYQYVVIDDCWAVNRDADGNIVVDAAHFPSGMKELGDYIHAKGLKFGIYSDAGEKTCDKRPGSQGHEFQDARMYAKWGVDYLKYDWCNTGKRNEEEAYTTMRDALKATGRPIVFSICEWGDGKPWLWAADIGNLWRTTGDISDKWTSMKKWPDGSCCEMGMMDIVDLQVGLESFAGPGHWNDPDMLEVGNGGMTATEYRTHFSLWCLLAAPLIAGNDLRSMTPQTKEILTNKELIAIDQDALGREGSRVWKDGGREIWSKQLKDGSRAVALVNRGAHTEEIAVPWEVIGYPAGVSAAVRDLWAHQELGKFTREFAAKVESHGVVMVTVRP